MRYKSILLVIPVFILSFAFSNCGDFKVLDSLTNSSAQTCTAQMRTKVQINFPKSLCEDVSNFECERRRFAPGISHGRTEDIECVQGDKRVESCIHVTTLHFDTSGARDGSEPREFEPGGEYNREEIQCWNNRIRKQNVSVIQAEADTIDRALASAVEICHERSSK